MPPPFRLGLTGGIGSGKSTVAGLLAQRGAAIVDADAISHQTTAAGGLAMPAIAAEFGPDFVTPDGALDRDRMRALVHTDASARRRLEAIVHPLVGQETLQQTARAIEQGRPCIVFDVPLLVESPSWRARVDHVLVVDCSAEVQISRVMARNQLPRADIEKIIASQTTRENRLRAADSVLFNETLSLAQLADEVWQLAPRFGLSSG
jgi:dephospho-CoA kinase